MITTPRQLREPPQTVRAHAQTLHTFATAARAIRVPLRVTDVRAIIRSPSWFFSLTWYRSFYIIYFTDFFSDEISSILNAPPLPPTHVWPRRCPPPIPLPSDTRFRTRPNVVHPSPTVAHRIGVSDPYTHSNTHHNTLQVSRMRSVSAVVQRKLFTRNKSTAFPFPSIQYFCCF